MNIPTGGMQAVINRKRYDAETATLLASDCYWDGHNFERSGTNTFLFLAPKGNYFKVYLTMWQGDSDKIEPLSPDEAEELWESLEEKEVSLEEAFPNLTAEDA